jgi:hypothetical protein
VAYVRMRRLFPVTQHFFPSLCLIVDAFARHLTLEHRVKTREGIERLGSLWLKNHSVTAQARNPSSAFGTRP